MTDKQKFLAFQKKFLRLKEEESLILKILKDVRKQLRKYEVEELQTCSESMVNKNADDSDSDQSSEWENETLLRLIDSARIVNARSLDLGTSNVFPEDDKNSEESDDSD